LLRPGRRTRAIEDENESLGRERLERGLT